jgi:hypothetical protein
MGVAAVGGDGAAADPNSLVGGCGSAAAVADALSLSDILTRSAGSVGSSYHREGSRQASADVNVGTAIMALSAAVGITSRAKSRGLKMVRRPVSLDAGRATAETASWLSTRQLTLGFDLDRPLPDLTPPVLGAAAAGSAMRTRGAAVDGGAGWDARAESDAASLRAHLAALHNEELPTTLHQACERRSVALDRVPLAASILNAVASRKPAAGQTIVRAAQAAHQPAMSEEESDIEDDSDSGLKPAESSKSQHDERDDGDDESAWLELAAAAEEAMEVSHAVPRTGSAGDEDAAMLELAEEAESSLSRAHQTAAATRDASLPYSAISLRAVSLTLAIGLAFGSSSSPFASAASVFPGFTSDSSARMPRSVEQRALSVASSLAQRGSPFPSCLGTPVSAVLTSVAPHPDLQALRRVCPGPF